ncbi:MAG TPA: CehA/McbA family metallohydrolase [Planctomycetota bacterium]
MRFTSRLLLLVGAVGAGLLTRLPAGPPEPVPTALADTGVHVLPFGLMPGVRRTESRVPMQVQLLNARETAVGLLRFEARAVGGALLAGLDLAGERLPGDGGAALELHRMLELADPHMTHRHANRVFVPLDARPVLGPAAEAALLESIARGVEALRLSAERSLRNLSFEVDLAQVFPAGAQPGDEAVLDLTLLWRDAAGVVRSTQRSHLLQLLAPYAAPPAAWTARAGSLRWAAGDLHVHNCRDQAVGGCPQDCAAESFNVTGSFTNAQLKAQFQALGFDYFSTSTHSYCLNDSEFTQVVQESNGLDEADFKVLCGTEVSGKETGAQTGSDSADALCALGFGVPVHHMGAHGITQRKPGGQDGFLDFCDSPIFGVRYNADVVRNEGGFTVVNHPTDAYFAFNSTYDLPGIEGNGVDGVEIWNGSGGGTVASAAYLDWWITRMLQGRILYAYSGSDTHDAAFDFGSTHVLVDSAFSEASLRAGLRRGRTYVSNGPFLAITLEDNHGRRAVMGDVAAVRVAVIPDNYPLTVSAYFDTGGAAGRVRIYEGRVGETTERLLADVPVSGGGVTTAAALAVKTTHSWYRAEFVRNDGAGGAWASPVFVRLLP